MTTFSPIASPGVARALNPRHGPHDPAGPPSPRRPGSVRRTTTHDSLRPDGLLGDVRLDARGRDLVTELDGTPAVVRAVELRATIDYVNGSVITALSSRPPADGLEQLVGAPAASGFRRALDALLPGERAANSLRYQLLDDFPTATLVGGHTIMAGGYVPQRGKVASTRNADLCAGWASDATIMIAIADIGHPPITTGPVAPELGRDDDPLAWHEVAPLEPHAMRRRRRTDVWRSTERGGERIAVDSFFRDSHVDGDGRETVIHEYSVTASIDPATMRFTACQATIGALPWQECPGAVASAGRLVGAPVEGLRTWVRDTFVGTTTCTHLNDTLRSLEDVPDLVTALPHVG